MFIVKNVFKASFITTSNQEWIIYHKVTAFGK